MKFNGFDEEELNKLQRAFSDKPGYKTSTGFTGNKKTKKERENWKVGKKRRKTDHLSNKERKQLASLHKQVDEIMVAGSHISKKSDDKLTKKDMKKGKNSNLGADGVHGSGTFKKYKSVCKTFVKHCFENYGIEHISEIKKGMFYDYMESMMKNGKKNGEKYSAKSLGLYKTAIKKMGEESTKAGKEYERLERLADKDVKEKFDKLKKNYDVKYSRENYKRGKNNDGTLGYSYKEARKIIKKANDMSAYHGSMYEVLAHGSPRHEELLKVKWRQIDTKNNRIYLDDPNQTKTNRPRFIPIPEDTSKKLQSMMESGFGKNPDTRVWGSRMTKDDVYNLTKDLCRQAHVGYGGVHDFRRSSTEYHQREIKKNLKKGRISKEQLAEKFLQHVSIYEKLNPIEVKKEKERDENGNIVYKQAKDKYGKPRFYANGKTRMEANWVPKVRDGEVIKDFRYTKEEVMEWRTDKLINSYISQVLGHNRTDATSPYKNG